MSTLRIKNINTLIKQSDKLAPLARDRAYADYMAHIVKKVKDDAAKLKRARERTRREEVRWDRIQKQDSKKYEARIANKFILDHILKGRLKITAKFMRSIKDKALKHEITKAICLGALEKQK